MYTIASTEIMTDDLGVTLVKFTCLIHTDDDDDEQYIHAQETQMIYNVVHELDKKWLCI